MGYAKTMVAFRLSDRTRDNLQEATELRRRLYELEDLSWMRDRHTRTDTIEQAIDFFLTDLRTRVDLADLKGKKGARKKK